jgi:hypothetical protein
VNYPASVGCSTCFWWDVLTSTALSDEQGWFKHLQQKVNQPFPKPLKQLLPRTTHFYDKIFLPMFITWKWQLEILRLNKAIRSLNKI